MAGFLPNNFAQVVFLRLAWDDLKFVFDAVKIKLGDFLIPRSCLLWVGLVKYVFAKLSFSGKSRSSVTGLGQALTHLFQLKTKQS